MPAEVPPEFQNEPKYSLWRDIARLFEDYTGDRKSFDRVVQNIIEQIDYGTRETQQAEIKEYLAEARH